MKVSLIGSSRMRGPVGACLQALALLSFAALMARAQANAGIDGVLAPGVTPSLVKEGFLITEGPVPEGGGGIYFSDINASVIYCLHADGTLDTVYKNTHGANGLALTAHGELLAAEGYGKRIARYSADGSSTAVSEDANHHALLAPNDLIIDQHGGLYFTDPGPRPVVAGRKAFVYYVPYGSTTPIVVSNEIARPNGITLTLDGRTLIVDDTLGDAIYAFRVGSEGMVFGKRVFAHLMGIAPNSESGADGMAIDSDGRLYVATVTGIQILDPAGKYLGSIRVPRQATNVAFGGENKSTLYITAREGLYRVQMLSHGPDRIGK
jgi:gluconolactonase